MTQKTNQNLWTMDVRVRERNLKSGALTDKDVEKYLASLPDLADQVEPFGTPQPALAQQPVVAEPAPVEDVPVQEEVQAAAEEPVAAAPEPPPPAPAPAPQVEEPAPAPAPVADGAAVTDGEGQQS